MNTLKIARRHRLLAGSFLTGLALSGAALAQEATTSTTPPPQVNEPSEQVEEVVVTGSRIKGKEYTSASPVTIITSERSAAAGLISASEILQSSTTAASSGQINNTFTGYVVGGGGGVNTISLRGLGAQRSLVLINGRRLPPAGVGGTVGPVDLNTIPSAFVARYEILKDGASSIYGSDAVAGVVNVITRSNLEGFQLETVANVTEQGGGETFSVSGMWGKSFSEGHLAIAAEAYEQKALVAGDREGFACPTDNYFNAGTRADIIDPATGTYKCFTHGAEGYVGTYGPVSALGGLAFYGSRAIAPDKTIDGVSGWDFIPFEKRSFNDPRAQSTTILSPIKRLSVFAQGQYRPGWLHGAEAYGELLLTRRQSEQVGWFQFFPYFNENSSINPFRNGTAPVKAFVENWPTDETLADLGFPGLVANPIVLYRNQQEQDVKTYRALGGVRGDWGNGWNYDAYLSYSRSDGAYESDVIINDRVAFGTGTNQSTLADMPGGVCGTGAPAGCVPLDLFSKDVLEDGKFSKGVLDYYFARDRGNTEYTQIIAEASVTGDLVTLPAGTVATAFGIAIRKDEINDTPGALSIARNIWGATSAGVTEGDDTLSEVYAEFEIPLINNIPYLVKDLKINISGRYSNYYSVGDATTYKLGLNWAVNDTLRFRATHGTSFRAPALYELFLKDQSGFLSQAQVDPCINWGATGADGSNVRNDLIRQNCAADGIAPNFGGGNASAEIRIGGGTGLRPETSTASTVGFVITPPESGLRLAIDFWKIDVEDQISSSGAAVVGACYAASDFATNGFCSLFERGPDGGISIVDASYRNIPSESTQGVDIAAMYQKQFNVGTLYLDLQATHTNEYLSQLFPGDVVYDYQGLIGQPDWVANLQARFQRKDWRFSYTLNYTGPTDNMGRFGEDGTSDSFYAPGATYRVSTDGWFTHDIAVSYTARDWTILAGVSNLTNEEPPILGNGTTYSRLGNYPLSSQYYEGMLGRQYFMRLSKEF